MSDYYCVNGAWHTDLCCVSCWNRHPNAEPEKCFLHSERRKRISALERWTSLNDDAESLNTGFTHDQMRFLFKYFFPTEYAIIFPEKKGP